MTEPRSKDELRREIRKQKGIMRRREIRMAELKSDWRHAGRLLEIAEEELAKIGSNR